MSSNNHQQLQLHVGLLGTRVTGWITRWMGKYGFILADHYTHERMFFSVSQFKDEGDPAAGLRVEFTLDRNERGWRAINAKRVVIQRIVDQTSRLPETNTPKTTAQRDTHTVTTSKSVSIPLVKFPVQYNLEENDSKEDPVMKQRRKTALDVLQQTMRLFQQLGESESSFLPRSRETLATTFVRLIWQLSKEIERKEFALIASSTLPADWQRIKEMQFMKVDCEKGIITIEDIRRLDSFQQFMQRPMFIATTTELLNEYAINISGNTVLPAFAKAAWIFIHLRQIVMDNSMEREGEERFHSVYLLMNLVLLQQGVPFLVTREIPRYVLEAKIEDISNEAVHEWLLFYLEDTFRAFNKRVKDTLRPQDPEKIVNNHRKKMRESGQCFVCFKKSRCTVSTLCCGGSAHGRCMQKWRESRQVESKGKGFLAPCPGCLRPCFEPMTEHQRNSLPQSGSSRPIGVNPSNNAYAVLHDGDDDDDDGWPENDGLDDDEENSGFYDGREDFDRGFCEASYAGVDDFFDDDMYYY